MGRGRTTSARSGADAPLLVHGANVVLELLGSGGPVSRLLVGPGPRRAELEAAAEARGLRPESADRGALDRLAGTPHHQGAVALAPPFRYAPLEQLCDPGCRGVVLLDGVQDPRNVGAIVRTARAAGAGGVVLPRDRSARVTSAVVTASAGLVFGLPIVQVTNLARAMEGLREAGYWLVGLLPRTGTPVHQLGLPGRPGLVVGGEGEGLRPLILRGCDLVASIPMAAGVESLNVSVALGIALYDLLVRRRPT